MCVCVRERERVRERELGRERERELGRERERVRESVCVCINKVRYLAAAYRTCTRELTFEFVYLVASYSIEVLYSGFV